MGASGLSRWRRALALLGVTAGLVLALGGTGSGADSTTACDLSDCVEPASVGGAVQDLRALLSGLKAHAVAAGDVNGDGWTDVYVGTFADRPDADYAYFGATGPNPDRLLLGGPSGFRLDPSFPAVWGRSSGAAFADLDNDNDLDLVILRQPRDGTRSSAPSVALRNVGGRFQQAAVLDATRGLRSVGVLDYNADGLLDLFLVEDRFSNGSSVLLRNDGGFRFTNVTTEAALPSDVHGLGVAAADLNGDSVTDLFVAGSNRLFLGRGGTFTEVPSIPEWEFSGDEDDVAGVAVADVNRDGRQDLLVGQHFNSTIDQGELTPVRLYLNRGNVVGDRPSFEDVTLAAGLPGLPTKSPHVELNDYDADGRVDLLLTASGDDGSEPVLLMGQRDDGLGYSAPSGLGSSRYWVAGASFDADRNGTLDVFVAEWDASLGSGVFRGPARTGNYIEVQVGPRGAGGIGSIVEVYSAGRLGDPAALLGSRPISASTGYGSGSLSVARIGVGSRTSVDVRVRQPNNAGVVDRQFVGVNRVLQVEELPAPGLSSVGGAVDLIVYDRPGYDGAPWSHRGQGLVTSDGRFVSALGDHLGADGNSFVHVYDPASGRLTQVGDALSAIPHNAGDWGYGKIHSQMVQTDANSVIMATYWGSRRGLTYSGTYSGDHLLRLDLRTMRLETLGAPIPGRGIPTLGVHGSRVYGIGVDPVTDHGAFFTFDVSTRRTTRTIFDTRLSGHRNVAVLPNGAALLATEGPTMLRYDPGASSLRTHAHALPDGWLRATTERDAAGTMYGVTRESERFVSIDAAGRVADLGAAPGYITSLALHDGLVYFVPGAHGDAPDWGTALMSVDPRTQQQAVVVELNPYGISRLGLTLGGSYGVVIDSARDRAFVQLNAGADPAAPWGEVVLAVIDLSGTTSTPVPTPTPVFCAPDSNPSPTPSASAASGYWVLARTGEVHAFTATHHGDVGGALPAGVTAVGLVALSDGSGYWIADSSGGVHAFGAAPHLGDMAGQFLGAPITGIAAAPGDGGYWLLGTDGGVFSFGTATFHGSTGAMTLNSPVIAMEAAPGGTGYWLLAADGGVFAFGSAPFRGSTGAMVLNAPVVGMAADGTGYWLVAADGGVFGFGVVYVGSLPGMGYCQPPRVRALAGTATGGGYYVLLEDGGIFTFGDAFFRGADPDAVVDPVDIEILP